MGIALKLTPPLITTVPQNLNNQAKLFKNTLKNTQSYVPQNHENNHNHVSYDSQKMKSKVTLNLPDP